MARYLRRLAEETIERLRNVPRASGQRPPVWPDPIVSLTSRRWMNEAAIAHALRSPSPFRPLGGTTGCSIIIFILQFWALTSQTFFFHLFRLLRPCNEKFKFVSLEFIFPIVSDFHVQIKKKTKIKLCWTVVRSGWLLQIQQRLELDGWTGRADATLPPVRIFECWCMSRCFILCSDSLFYSHFASNFLKISKKNPRNFI